MARRPYSQLVGPPVPGKQAVAKLHPALARAVEGRGQYGGGQGQESCEVSSTAINDINYDQRGHRLFVTFNSGRRYTYFDVSAEQYQKFCDADSKGRYFNKVIRDKYAYAKIG